MTPEELTQLIDELLDGDCSESDFLRLEAELHVNPEARALYYERMKLHTALRIESEENPAAQKIRPFPRQRPATFSWAAGIAAALALLLVGLAGWKLGRSGGDSFAGREEPLASGFGVLAEQSNAVWDSAPIDRGDLLPTGKLKLKSGIAQLELFSGVSVILEGETEFEVYSSMEMSVNRGKLRAHVPEPARGFRVRTANGDVVDLGTEFAIDVTGDHSDVHVFDGEIEWHPLTDTVQRLVNGDSMRWTATGKEAEAPDLLNQFPAASDLEAELALRRDKWSEHSLKLRKDPRLLVYFPMDQPGDWKRTLTDESGAEQNGVIVRASRSADRWGKQGSALDFSPTGSRVRLTIPGEHSAITMYCWVRIDSLDRWYNSLFLTDGHDLHEPHWQIMDDGRLFFSVKAREGAKGKPDKHVAYSPPIWTPALSGQWMQIVTTYDSSTRTTTHYVNGKRVSEDRLADEYVVDKVSIGAASIGNWSEPMREDPHFAVRNLNGAIDEFAIFSVALTADEIRELYKLGKP